MAQPASHGADDTKEASLNLKEVELEFAIRLDPTQWWLKNRAPSLSTKTTPLGGFTEIELPEIIQE